MRLSMTMRRVRNVFAALFVSAMLVFGFALSPGGASAGAAGMDISDCSYAGNYCVITFTTDQAGYYTLTWYGYNGYYWYDSFQVYCNYGWCSGRRWAPANSRMDTATIEGPGTVWPGGVYVNW